MTKLRALAPAFLLALAPAASIADDYSFEIRGSFDNQNAKSDGDTSADVNVARLGGTWYFAPVSTDNVPLAEAAYLGHASFLSGGIAGSNTLGTTLGAQDMNVGYYIPGTMFYAAAGVAHQEDILAISQSFVQTEYRTSWFGKLGVTPLDGLLVTTDFREHGYDPNLTARYVGRLPNDHFYAGSVNYTDADTYLNDATYGVNFDYYFDDSASLGAGYESGGDLFAGDDRFEIRAEKFFMKDWAAGVSVYTADRSNGVGFHVTWRH
jgi:hypothetical protein